MVMVMIMTIMRVYVCVNELAIVELGPGPSLRESRTSAVDL
jgi:hypothetical protein